MCGDGSHYRAMTAVGNDKRAQREFVIGGAFIYATL